MPMAGSEDDDPPAFQEHVRSIRTALQEATKEGHDPAKVVAESVEQFREVQSIQNLIKAEYGGDTFEEAIEELKVEIEE